MRALSQRIPLYALLMTLAGCVSVPAHPSTPLSPLGQAVLAGQLDLVKTALDGGADPSQVDTDGINAWVRLSFRPEMERTMANIFLDKCAVTYVLDGNCGGALHYAAKFARLDAVKALVARGAPVDERARGGSSSLLPAIIGIPGIDEQGPTQRLEVVRFLLGKGADANAMVDSGEAFLYYAIYHRRVEIVKLLLEHGADPNGKGYQGQPLLYYATEGDRDAAMARALIEKGADPEPAIAQWEKVISYYESQHNPAYDPLISAGRAAIRLISRLSTDHRATTQTAPAAPTGGVTREELASIVQAAVKGAAQERTETSKPTLSLHSSVDKPSFHLPEHPDDFALVVGIGKYSDLPEARFAERDAEAVKNHLLAMGYPSRNVVSLSGEKAVRSGLEKFLESWLPRNVTGKSRVFFYFSGHGAPDPSTGQAYLVPWDGDPSFLENTAYPLSRLYQKLTELKAKEVIVALDACFSGAGGRSVLAKGARPIVTRTAAVSAPSTRFAVFAAASGEQITSTFEEEGHGLFTFYFLDGLDGKAKDDSGVVTARGLYEYLKPKVQDAARRQNRDQTPSLQGAAQEMQLVRF